MFFCTSFVLYHICSLKYVNLDNLCTQTHTLRAAKTGAEVVTSLLVRRVTNEPEHIVLALEMSRGVKMSPQIAPGHQMSPFHSTLHLSLPPTQFFLLSNAPLFLSPSTPQFSLYADLLRSVFIL